MSVPNLKARVLPAAGDPAANLVSPTLEVDLDPARVLRRMTSEVDEAAVADPRCPAATVKTARTRRVVLERHQGARQKRRSMHPQESPARQANPVRSSGPRRRSGVDVVRDGKSDVRTYRSVFEAPA